MSVVRYKTFKNENFFKTLIFYLIGNKVEDSMFLGKNAFRIGYLNT